jgi:DNA recombination protein RmuC
MLTAYLITGIVGVGIGALFSWLVLRTRAVALQSRLGSAEKDLSNAGAQLVIQQESLSRLRDDLTAAKTTLGHERKNSEEKLALLTAASEDLRNAFGKLATEALQRNNRSFLDLAETKLGDFQNQAQKDLETRQRAVADLVTPLQTSIDKLDSQVQQMETTRSGAYATLTEQVRSLASTQEQLRGETGNLVKALRTPAVRGRWGEIQLKRVVEIAGMLPYCDFAEQETVHTEEGRLRPDLVIRLPGGKRVVVDAKTPLDAFLNATASTNEDERRRYLADHARQVRDHMERLSSKSYWEQFESSPEFVFMFLPGETFFSAALEQDPTLIERGVNQQVILASPTTLIALLRAVAYGWRQESLARHVQQIRDLGKELHGRISSLVGHFENVGGSLHRAVESYNKLLGSLESRVLVSARKFAALGAPIAEEIPELSPIETTTRQLSPEWSEQATIFEEHVAHHSAEPEVRDSPADHH